MTRKLSEKSSALGREYMVLIPALVLLSLASQLILFFVSNLRKRIKSRFLDAILWSAYMTSDALAIWALSVISNDLSDTLDCDISQSGPGRLEPRLQLVTFWAPFLLLHLGGPDTITAFELQDNELWKRHLLGLGVRTALTAYILYRAWTPSTLSSLSAMMLAAGSIKYAERTWSLWSASSDRRQKKAEQGLLQSSYMPEQEITLEVGRPINLKDEVELVVVANKMYLDTKCTFANALVTRDVQWFKKIVAESSPEEVMRLIEIELKMIYDNFYTKARAAVCPWVVLRFISFLLTCITLILFSSVSKQFGSLYEYSLTIFMLAVSIILDLCAAFISLTSYGMISWFGNNRMVCMARCLTKLAVLRSRDWSNSMGQFSEIRYFIQHNLKWRQLIMSMIFFWRSGLPLRVYHRGVPDELKRFMLGFLEEVSNVHKPKRKFSLLRSRGREPWELYKKRVSGGSTKGEPGELHNERVSGGSTELTKSLEKVSPIFEKEFGQTIIFLHLVTEVCYYLDRPFIPKKFEGNVPNNNVFENGEDVFMKSKVSKHLSRYLMHLFVDSSDLLPLQSPLSRKIYEQINHMFGALIYPYRYNDAEGGGKRETRRADKVKACRLFWELELFGDSEGLIALRVTQDLLKAMRPGSPGSVCPSQLKERWDVLSEVWAELLVFVAVQCRAAAHAQHLRQGGELLTHVWALLGHFGFLDEALLPINNVIDTERLKFYGLLPDESEMTN